MVADNENVFHSLKLLFVCFIHEFNFYTCYFLFVIDLKLSTYYTTMDKFIIRVSKSKVSVYFYFKLM
ncbi:Uncharacterized protein FWK35_00034397 [Aphis craccivora]|uniref:Uncharacterized protein n=1 Tax=Aphis craccivora TaxID=307492 RepID=A0A6G0VVA7_APHCR|nr:Uncharacterized protein FWK35_00034397 [Aphis craccivora]